MQNRRLEFLPEKFYCLKGKTIRAAKLSDHQPVLHQGVLFWNIMMQAKKRQTPEGKCLGYNNGFASEEKTLTDYYQRLEKVIWVIAEIISCCPSIDIISLCEGPLQAQRKAFVGYFQRFAPLERFISLDSPVAADAKSQDWGLYVFADKSYQALFPACSAASLHSRLKGLDQRFYFYTFKKQNKQHHLVVTHLPLSGNEEVVAREKLTPVGQGYCEAIQDVLKRYENDSLHVCGDFNLNPYLIARFQDRYLDRVPIKNSIMLAAVKPKTTKSLTVDAILLSRYEKQKYYVCRVSSLLFAKKALANDEAKSANQVVKRQNNKSY